MSIHTENKKAALVVAHPDDCVIFGWPIIKYYKQWEWTIIYLTHQEHTPRAQEVKRFWQNENIKTLFCGYEDHPQDLAKNEIVTFDADEAKQKIKELANGFDIIVTHNEDGDYGHPHHVLVHGAMIELGTPKIYFSNTADDFCITESMYDDAKPDMESLPLHRSVIEMFEDRHQGKYKLSAEVLDLIERN